MVTAEAQTLPRTLSAVGSLESPDMTAIAAEIPGTVVSLDVPEGKRVEAGHVVARLDDAEARAALSVASARLENARARLARQGPLHEQGVASDQSLDDARAELRGAEGAYEEARTRLEKHTIRAPFGGVLGLRQVNVGQYVPAGQPIVEITLVGRARAALLPAAEGSAAARAGPEGGTAWSAAARRASRAQVTAVDPRVDPATRMVGPPGGGRRARPARCTRAWRCACACSSDEVAGRDPAAAGGDRAAGHEVRGLHGGRRRTTRSRTR